MVKLQREKESTYRTIAGNNVVVRAEAIWKSYRTASGAVEVLRDVDLAIESGSVVAVMGASGCGKTTLLNCLSGLDTPEKGMVTFEDVDVTRASDKVRTRLRSQRMGFVFQAFNLVPVLDVLANVRLHLELGGMHRTEAQKRALSALSSVGLEGFGRRGAAELSGGQQQRVAIARAIASEPSIIWADEPTGSLDSSSGQQILDLFKSLNSENGTTFVVVTHDPKATRIADRVVQMDSGRIVGEG